MPIVRDITLVFFSVTLTVVVCAILIPIISPNKNRNSYFNNYEYDIKWIKRIEREIRNQEEEEEYKDERIQEINNGVDLTFYFSTPILKINMLDFMKNIDKEMMQSLNANLTSIILAEYNNIEETMKKKLDHDDNLYSGGSRVNINQLFYDFQTKYEGYEDKFAGLREYKEILIPFFKQITSFFLQELHVPVDKNYFKRLQKQDLDVWNTVHKKGSSHYTHVHKNAAISGCYYVKVNQSNSSGGRLFIEDPRGVHFESRVSYKPRPGDVIIFPSWVPHHVESNFDDNERISIAFNVEGDWELTNNINFMV